MARSKRIALIKEIEKARNSRVICYITSDRPGANAQISGDIVPIIHEHILGIKEKDRQKLDLFIYSRGGDANVPWPLVSMFREYAEAGLFSVLIPFRAHSAATVIALGADEIVMTKKAELGPIDITINTPHNPTHPKTGENLPVSVEDVASYFRFLEKIGIGRADETVKGLELLSRKVPPLVLGIVNRNLEQTKLVAERLLNTRKDPMTEEACAQVIKTISSEVYSHQHAISRTEAIRNIGLPFVKKAEDVKIENEMWKLYEEYKQFFELEKPLLAEEYLLANNLEEYTWQNLVLACVESVGRCDVCRQDRRMRRLRKVPPNVQLQVNLGAINIPIWPPTLTDAQAQQHWLAQIIQQMIQQVVDQACAAATQKLIQSLPAEGYELATMNSRWNEEN